jgi:hypothetical protein
VACFGSSCVGVFFLFLWLFKLFRGFFVCSGVLCWLLIDCPCGSCGLSDDLFLWLCGSFGVVLVGLTSSCVGWMAISFRRRDRSVGK